MSSEPPEQPSGGAQARLDELLAPVRAQPPEARPQLTLEILKAARLERKLRAAAVTAAGFGGIVLEGLTMLLGLRRRQ